MSDLIFEVIEGEHHYKIYRNGNVEGFKKNAIVVNWLFAHDKQAQAVSLLPKKRDSTSLDTKVSHDDNIY